MRINWKFLCRLGFLFWSAMCILEYTCGSILNNGEFEKMIDVQEDMPMTDFFEAENWKQNIIAETSLQWANTLLWFSILSSLFGFLIVRYTNKFFQKQVEYQEEINNNDIELLSEEVAPPIMDQQTSNTNLVELTTVDSSTGLIKSSQSSRQIQDEQESVTCREHVPLSTSFNYCNKRLEAVSEERRHLAKQLELSEKENRLAKEKMMVVLKDKNILLRRLEIATKEIKNNSAAKQATLEKLEESQNSVKQMKERVQQLTNDNRQLARKIKSLEMLLRSAKTKRSISETCFVEVRKDASPSTSNCDDIEQIESKLQDLEKSLESIKYPNECLEDEQSAGTALKMVSSIMAEIGDPENFKVRENSSDSVMEHPIRLVREISRTDLSHNTHIEPSTTNIPINEQQKIFMNVIDSLGPTFVSGVLKGRTPSDRMAVMEVFGKSLTDLISKINKGRFSVAAPLHKSPKCLELNDDEDESSKTASSQESNVSLTFDDSEAEVAQQLQAGRVSESPAFQNFLQKIWEMNH